MITTVYAAFFVGACALSGYAGLFVYANWTRVALAAGIICGRIAYDEKNGKFGCARPHLEPGYVVVKDTELKELQRAANELVFARGYVAEVEAARGKTTYAEAYLEVSGK